MVAVRFSPVDGQLVGDRAFRPDVVALSGGRPAEREDHAGRSPRTDRPFLDQRNRVDRRIQRFGGCPVLSEHYPRRDRQGRERSDQSDYLPRPGCRRRVAYQRLSDRRAYRRPYARETVPPDCRGATFRWRDRFDVQREYRDRRVGAVRLSARRSPRVYQRRLLGSDHSGQDRVHLFALRHDAAVVPRTEPR